MITILLQAPPPLSISAHHPKNRETLRSGRAIIITFHPLCVFSVPRPLSHFKIRQQLSGLYSQKINFLAVVPPTPPPHHPHPSPAIFVAKTKINETIDRIKGATRARYCVHLGNGTTLNSVSRRRRCQTE